MDGLNTDQERVETWLSSWKYSFVGMAIVDKDFNFVAVNKQWVKILGVSATEFYHHTFTDITPPEVRDADVEQAKLVMQGKIDSYMMHKSYRFTNGKEVPITLLVTRVPINTELPFSHFLSRIMVRERRDLGQGSSIQTLIKKSLDFVMKYWMAIAIGTAAVTGAVTKLLGYEIM